MRTFCKGIGLLTLLACIGMIQGQICRAAEPVDDVLKRLNARVGVDKQGQVVLVHLEGKPATDADLAVIAQLEGLTNLYLARTKITDDGLRHIGKLKNLRRLSLWQTAITDAGLAHLTGLKRLEALDLNHTAVTDAGLTHIAKLESLNLLNLNTLITDDGLRHVGKLKSLRRLSLRHAAITDKGLAHLAGLKQLEVLELHHTAITDAGLVHLYPLSKLRYLNTQETRATSDGRIGLADDETRAAIKSLKDLGLRIDFNKWGTIIQIGPSDAPKPPEPMVFGPQCWSESNFDFTGIKATDQALQSINVLYRKGRLGSNKIDLSGSAVTDAQLEHLVDLKRLCTLKLRDTAISADAIAHLEKLRNLRLLSIENTRIKADELSRLNGIRNLEDLTIGGPTFSDEDVAKLSGLRNIRFLKIVSPKVAGRTLSAIEGGFYLTLDCPEVTDDALGELGKIEGLTRIEFIRSKVTRAAAIGLLLRVPEICTVKFPDVKFEYDLTYTTDFSVEGEEAWDGDLSGLEEIEDLSIKAWNSDQLVDLRRLAALRTLQVRSFKYFDDMVPIPPLPGTTGAPEVRGESLGNEVMRHITPLENLEHLKLNCEELTDGIIDDLGRMKSLRTIEASGTKVTKRAIELVTQLPHLKTISFREGNLTIEDNPELGGRSVTLFLRSADEVPPDLLAPLATLENVRRLCLSLWVYGAKDHPVLPLDEGIKKIIRMKELRELSLNNWQLSPTAIELLAHLPYLDTLELCSIATTGERLEDIARLPQFRILRFEHGDFSETGLAPLNGMPNLEEISLTKCKIGPTGLDGLDNLPRLQTLSLASSGLEDAGAAALENFPLLESLDLYDCPITSAAMPHITKLDNLKTLKLHGTKVDDDGMRDIGRLKKLKRLSMWYDMGDASMPYIGKLTELEDLRVSGNVTETGLKHLAGLTRLRSLWLDCDMTSKELKHLATLTELRDLYISCYDLSFEEMKEGLEVLSELPHIESIYFDGIGRCKELDEMFKGVKMNFYEG